MIERYGNFEIDKNLGFVRVHGKLCPQTDNDDYLYLIKREDDGESTDKLLSLFVKAYELGRSDVVKEMKRVLEI